MDVCNSLSGKTTSLQKKVKQRNHDGGVIPETLREYSDYPLYILIAIWCHQQDKWIDRQQISDTFAITPRRASFQIAYILNQNHFIELACRKMRNPETGRLRQEIRVHGVDLEGIKRQDKEPPSRKAPASTLSKTEREANWHWVLTRQSPVVK